MVRERALKIVLALVGLLFAAAIYPVIGGLLDPAHSDTGDTMMMGLYFALGIFLLIAVRNPSAHRSLKAFKFPTRRKPRCVGHSRKINLLNAGQFHNPGIS